MNPLWIRPCIKEWTNLSTEELVQSTKDLTAWRSVVCRAANVRTNDPDDAVSYVTQRQVMRARNEENVAIADGSVTVTLGRFSSGQK